jgi:hypothetical protein
VGRGIVVTPFEYLLLFAAVILGLAITDLAVSLHRLLSAGDRVRWDWLAPLAAIVAILKIVTQWWSWFGVGKLANGLTFEMFLLVLTSGILLFLLTATALPDDFGDKPVDLRAHYAATSRRYWILFLAQWLLATGVSIWAQVRIGGAHLNLLTPVWLIIPAALSLILIRNRWWHTIGLLGFIALYVSNYVGQPLSH